MKKLILGTLAGVAAFAMAAPANAAQSIVISGPSGTFGNDTVSGAFVDTFGAITAAGFNIASLSITSTQVSPETALDFVSVMFNGQEFNTVSTGVFENRNLGPVPLLASNTLRVEGVAGSNASYSGTIVFAAAPAVPEPGTWAMMLVGFGAVGYGMRRTRKANVIRMQAA